MYVCIHSETQIVVLGFSKQLGYCSCVTILPMLIERMRYSYSNQWDTGEVYSSAVQTLSDVIASHYNHSILSNTVGRIVLYYPSHANF